MRKLNPEQVFIVGMNGSGTTMLLDHLSSHSRLFGYPGETKLLPYFIRHQSKFGDLQADRAYLRLWEAMRSSIAGRIGAGPERIPLPSDWRQSPRSAAHVFDRIMRLFAAEAGKIIWCEKTPMHVNHLTLLANAFPGALFIHIIRDGRDCASSFHRRWKFNPLRTVYRWKCAVRSGRAQGSELGPRYLETRYEDVTHSPIGALTRICDFLGLEFEPALLNAIRSRPHTVAPSGKSIAPNPRSGSSYFSASTAARMEAIAGRYLNELGYACGNLLGDEDPPGWKTRWWEITDDATRLGVLSTENGGILKAANWSYVYQRVRNSLRQKVSLRQ